MDTNAQTSGESCDRTVTGFQLRYNVSAVTVCHCDDSTACSSTTGGTSGGKDLILLDLHRGIVIGMAGAISTSLEKLDKAVAALEGAVDARIEREQGLVQAEAEVQRMGADRARLAESLDSAVAKSQRLENANREVSRRLVDAMESIRGVLDRQPG